MVELILSRDERLDLRGRAHHLNPVVLLGAAGLSDAVIKEIDRALNAHELIKIRVPADDRESRDAMFAELAARLGAARVQMIGKLLVLYRPKPDEPVAADKRRAPAKRNERATRVGPAKPQRDEIRRTERRVAPRRAGGRGR
jgi:putative YhbY family RNA-binding protein